MTKCSLCGSKAKRSCKHHNGEDICPRCCALSRSAEKCAGCSHFATAQNFQKEKIKKGDRKRFIVSFNQELEDSIGNALELIDKKRFTQAEVILQKAEALDPGYYLLAFARGTIHAMRNELDQAISCFDRAIQIYPYYVEAHFNRAIAFQKMLDIPNTIRSFRNVVETGDPDDALVRSARNFLHKFEENIRSTDGTDVDSYLYAYDAFDRGIELMEKQEWENAIAAFRESSRHNPKSPKPYGNTGLCQAKLGNTDDAMKSFDKALELDPEYEPVIINRAALSRGVKLPDGPISMIEYAKDFQMKGKSLISELWDRIKGA